MGPSMENCSLSELLDPFLLLYYDLTVYIGPLLKEHVEFLERSSPLDVFSSLLQHFFRYFPRIENLNREIYLT